MKKCIETRQLHFSYLSPQKRKSLAHNLHEGSSLLTASFSWGKTLDRRTGECYTESAKREDDMLHNEDLLNGHPLRVLRTQLDLSQKDLATRVGVSEATIIRAENGHRLSPKVRHLLCDYLGRTSEELGLMGRKREVIRPASSPPQAPQTIPSQAVSPPLQSMQAAYVKDAPTFTIHTEPSKVGSFLEPQQEQAWLTLGASSLGQLFNNGWSFDEILDSVRVVLQGVEGMPAMVRQQLLISSMRNRADSVSDIRSLRLSDEERALLHTTLSESIVSNWKLFLSASNTQMLAHGQVQLSLLHQVHPFLYPSVRPYLYTGAYGLIGLALHFQNSNEEALRVYHNTYLSALATRDPWYVAQSLICQADVYLSLGMHAEALHVIKEALDGLREINEEHKRAKAHLLGCWADVHMTMGEFTQAQKRLDEASRYLDSSTVIEEFDYTCWLQLAGKRAVMAGDYQQAIAYLEDALAVNPPLWRVRHAGILIPLAIAYARKKEREKSFSIAQQAIPLLGTLNAPMLNTHFLNYLQDDIGKSFPSDRSTQEFLTEIQQKLPHILKSAI
jgi:tetratricopeptide (TPR) repeat protein/transcriptional regulator with XRE-family HTH domain